MRRPRPTPKKIAPATERMTGAELSKLAGSASYIGSSDHKDIPAMGIVPKSRRGAVTIEVAEAGHVNNPDCTLCPRKWARMKGEAATELLREGIRLGQMSEDATPKSLPARVWVRDPEEDIVYEAKRLSHPANGYKAYPLTSRQSRNLPLSIQ